VKKYDDMLSRFHMIPERNGQTDRQTDGQTDRYVITNRAMLVCKDVEVWQDFLSEYVDKKFTYICYRRLIIDMNESIMAAKIV